MLCQHCGKNAANTHIKTVVNGKLSQLHLCAGCAREMGYESLLTGWGSDLGGFLGGLLDKGPGREESPRCPGCGMSFEEIVRSGRMGCAQCYQTFRSRLLPTVQRIHGTTRHTGKVPGAAALRIADPKGAMVPVEESPLSEKKRLLQEAVEAQEFERAAVLRDEIREMEEHEKMV